MKILRLLLIVLCSTVAMEAYAIEPSTQIVVRNGRKVYVHKVEKGHTIYSIAKAYGVTEKQIIDCNEGLSPATLKIDDVIFVPCLDKSSNSKKTSASSGKGGGKYVTHVVKSGDTYYSIARQYKISVDVLRADNPSVDPNKLSLGTELRIRRSEVGYATTEEINRSESSASQQELRPNQHVVAYGETVYSLSKRAGLTEREFMALNKLRTPGDLKVGMVVLMRSDIEEQDADIAPGEGATPEQSEQNTEAEQPEASEQPSEEVEEVAVVGDDDVDPKPRERLSGRSDDDPVVDEWSLLPWFMFGGEDHEDSEFKHADIDFIELGKHNKLKVSLLLPFHTDGEVKPQYVDLYRGVLLAMEDLKSEGLTIDLTVFDTKNDANVIDDILTYEDSFLDSHLIIGPVHEKEVQRILNHAEKESVAIVSPLTAIESLESPVIFQMQPKRSHKYEKVKHLLNDDREVIIIYADSNDNGYLKEVKSAITSTRRRELVFAYANQRAYFYKRTASGGRGEAVSIDEIIRSRHDKTIIIAADDVTNIDRILTTLSSTKAKLLDRGSAIGRYDVIGNYKWTRFDNVDPQSFFKNNVSFITSYNLKRSNEIIRLFDARYIKRFGCLPSAFSYRGYDAALIFCTRMYAGLDEGFLGHKFRPLTTAYRFVPERGINVNTEWVCESYKDDFTISIR